MEDTLGYDMTAFPFIVVVMFQLCRNSRKNNLFSRWPETLAGFEFTVQYFEKKKKKKRNKMSSEMKKCAL